MVLLIDNYDSFSFNLVQMLGELISNNKEIEEIKIVRNDEYTVEEILEMNPTHIVLSPGPGRPIDAGICEKLIQAVVKRTDIALLGVCLGHQAICEALGGYVGYARQLMHGKQSLIEVDSQTKLFQGLENKIKVARYHSLVAKPENLPDCLKVTAKDEIGEIMAVEHKTARIYGLQFHPESIMTPDGKHMLQAFLTDERG